MMYPLVTDLASTAGHHELTPVTTTCRVLGFSKQAYYAWRAASIPTRDWDEAHLIDAARDAHSDDPAFGYRFIGDEIRKDLAAAGVTAGENRVARPCSQERIWSVFAKKRGLNRRAGPPVRDDLVERNFFAEGPDQLWLTDITDITEHWTGKGKLYACVIKDVFSNRIVGYSIDSRMKASLAVDALRMAIARRSPIGPVTVHSDRGSHFRARSFVRELNAAGLVGSMSRVGACGDNAAMESFFALLQRNVLDRQRWSTRDELRLAIVTWMERAYHRRRRQRGLGRVDAGDVRGRLRAHTRRLKFPAALTDESQREQGQSPP